MEPPPPQLLPVRGGVGTLPLQGLVAVLALTPLPAWILGRGEPEPPPPGAHGTGSPQPPAGAPPSLAARWRRDPAARRPRSRSPPSRVGFGGSGGCTALLAAPPIPGWVVGGSGRG